MRVTWIGNDEQARAQRDTFHVHSALLADPTRLHIPHVALLPTLGAQCHAQRRIRCWCGRTAITESALTHSQGRIPETWSGVERKLSGELILLPANSRDFPAQLEIQHRRHFPHAVNEDEESNTTDSSGPEETRRQQHLQQLKDNVMMRHACREWTVHRCGRPLRGIIPHSRCVGRTPVLPSSTTRTVQYPLC